MKIDAAFVWTWFLTLLPIIYVWTLPFLRLWIPGIIETGDVNNVGDKSVSSYISKPHGTAIMATLMFYPNVLMWEGKLIMLESMMKYKHAIRATSF